MKTICTKYGDLKGATHIRYYPNGNIRDCVLSELNEFETAYGKFIPQYRDDSFRRKHVKPVIFHENGIIKNLPLQNKAEITTPAGVFPAELITWYDDGSINRIFPLDGKLTGFWEEKDEYELAEELKFNFSFGEITQKIIAVQFFKNSSDIKSITLWPKDKITILSPVGVAEARTGITLYPGGSLKSFEPGKPLQVDTPIGKITAYDRTAIGIHSDSNSLRFTKTGAIEHIVTSLEMVKITDKKGEEYTYQPHFQPSMFNLGVMELIPMSIQFDGKKVRFNNSSEDEYDLEDCQFTVSQAEVRSLGGCSSCHECTACG